MLSFDSTHKDVYLRNIFGAMEGECELHATKQDWLSQHVAPNKSVVGPLSPHDDISPQRASLQLANKVVGPRTTYYV